LQRLIRITQFMQETHETHETGSIRVQIRVGLTREVVASRKKMLR